MDPAGGLSSIHTVWKPDHGVLIQTLLCTTGSQATWGAFCGGCTEPYFPGLLDIDRIIVRV